MKTKLLFIFSLAISTLAAQQNYNLGWSTTGDSVDQQLTIEVGDTITWTWGPGTHNLEQIGDNTEPGFAEGYASQEHVYSHTFTTVGAHDYKCAPHPSSMYGTITVTNPPSNLSETVIAVWDFVAGSTAVALGDGFTTTGGNSLGWLKNGDQSGVSDPNSVVQSGRNGFSGGFLQGIDITSTDLVDGKLHISITYNNIDLTGTGTIQQLFLKGSGNPTYADNHRMVGLKLTHDATNSDIKVESIVLNNGIQFGGSKDQGGLGNSSVYNEQITLGTTMDFINGTSSFWVGSPGENTTNPYGLTMATNDVNQSTNWNAASVTMAPSAILKLLQFQSKNGDVSVEVDQVKISTGTYENTVASGDGEGQEEPESALSMQGIIDFSLPGGWAKAVHLVATEDIADLSVYGIAAAMNGAASSGTPDLNLTGSALAGDHILVAKSSGATETLINTYMNASNVFDDVQIFNTALQNFNGDDAIELYFNGSVVEAYGEVGVDGDDGWNGFQIYDDTWAYKGADGVWTFGNTDCTDNSYYMWDSGCEYPYLVDKQATGTWGPVNSYEHTMAGIGQAGVWFKEDGVAMRRKTSATGTGTDTALEYLDDGTGQYANMQIRFNGKIDMTAMNTYTMDVYIDAVSLTGSQTNQLALKLQDATEATPWTNQNVVTQEITPDVWQTVTFAFNGDDAMSRDDVDNIVVQFNSENNNDAVKAYIKNVVGSYTEPVATEYTDVTFNVDTASIPVGVGANGMYLGGGVFGNAWAQPMTDTDGDGIWTVTVTLEEGTAGNYIFLDSPGWDSDWDAKENLGGQSCADAGNFDDRILSAVGADDYTLNHCFGNCDTDPTTGFCIIPETDYEVTFNVDTNNVIVGDGGMYLGDGIFGGSNAVAMSDDDGDGIWTVTVTLAEGTTGNYAFFKNPGDGSDWGTKENLEGQACADTNNYNNRILDPVTADTTINYCFATCDASCGTVVRHDVTFNVDTADITVGETGMFLGGGIMGGANAFAMSDTDGDGVYSVTVSVPEGTSGNYVFLNASTAHWNWEGKEDLTGQACADGQNNDRLLDAVTGPTTISYCFATCEVSCSTAGLDDLGMSQFTYYPNPVNDQLTIRAQSNVKDITVFNMLGQVVSSQSPNAKDCLVDMAAMQSGAYFVQISIGSTVEMVRVLKQ